jgi:hypothetical protein
MLKQAIHIVTTVLQRVKKTGESFNWVTSKNWSSKGSNYGDYFRIIPQCSRTVINVSEDPAASIFTGTNITPFYAGF